MAFATPGKSGPQHLAFESIKSLGGFQAEHIPYKGGGQAIVEKLAEIGMDNSTSPTPEDFTQWVQKETNRWPALFKAAGIQPD